MEQKKIYPYLIESKRIAGYYEMLLDDGYRLKIFDRKKEKEIYNYFLPVIRDYMFWTFHLKESKKEEFEDLQDDLKAAVCGNYNCNIFEKGDSRVMCFSSGICFAITSNKKIADTLVKYEEKEKMKQINLREDECYSVPEEIAGKDVMKAPELYAYVLQLYKMIYLNKIQKEIQLKNMFDKARNSFVSFTQKIYNVKETDKMNEEDENLCEKWAKELNIEQKYIKIENEFDLLYKNNKLNENQTIQRFCIVLFAILILIGIINLGKTIL